MKNMSICTLSMDLADGNGREAARLYQERYPNRRLPDHRTFARIHQRLLETGSFSRRSSEGRPISVRTPELEEAVLEDVGQHPTTSTRRLALRHDVSQHTICSILHQQLLYPYHILRVQALTPNDYNPRQVFSQWLLQKRTDDRDFLCKIIFTDEAFFTRDGIFNFHNYHEWSDENPHAKFESRHQVRFSLNVWAGIVGSHILGPIFLPQRLTGQSYLHFLRNDFLDTLEDCPIAARRGYWFMHDGAPAHFAVNVREHLDRCFPQKWIGRNGPVNWPPRSPDLNPLDFCIWGYVKSLVYSGEKPIDTVEELRQKIIMAFDEIKNKDQLCLNIRQSLTRRIQCCVEMRGGHIEHLL